MQGEPWKDLRQVCDLRWAAVDLGTLDRGAKLRQAGRAPGRFEAFIRHRPVVRLHGSDRSVDSAKCLSDLVSNADTSSRLEFLTGSPIELQPTQPPTQHMRLTTQALHSRDIALKFFSGTLSGLRLITDLLGCRAPRSLAPTHARARQAIVARAPLRMRQ